jgi:hypothetical protein
VVGSLVVGVGGAEVMIGGVAVVVWFPEAGVWCWVLVLVVLAPVW